MAKNVISICIEIEPIVKLTCLDFKCKNNMRTSGFCCCNLKHVYIDSDGKCKHREKIKTLKEEVEAAGIVSEG